MPASRTKAKVKNEKPPTNGHDGFTVVDPEMVARLAHSYWEARGGEGGSPEEDWLRAEQELHGRMAKAATN